MPGLDAVSFLSSAGIANVVELTVASLVSPTELNSVGFAVPDLRLCRPVSAGSDDATLYRLDASTDAVSAPYIMASATVGLRWVAIAGRYINSAITSAGAVTGTNISGTNTGDVTLAAIGAVPNANAASLSGQVLTLQPASASFGGLITTGPQTIAGAKTFLSLIVSKPAGSAGIAIDPNAATGDFTLSLSPANLTAARRWSYPDRSDTVAGLGAQTFTGAQTIAALTLITDTTDATTPFAAALVCSGGIAVAKKGYFGQSIFIQSASANQNLNIQCSNSANLCGMSLTNYGGTTRTTSIYCGGSTSGLSQFYVFDDVAGQTRLSLSAAGDWTMPNTTDATTTTTAALVVTGGVAVGKRLCLDGATGKTIKYVNGTANGAVAVSFGAVGPTGSTAGNAQGWIRIDVAGTDRYIPFW